MSARIVIEATTDAGQQQLIDALGENLDRTVGAGRSRQCRVLRAAAAPADPRKRAAG